MAQALKAFLKDIRSAVPPNQVYTDPLRRIAWGTDGSFYRLTPQAVIRSQAAGVPVGYTNSRTCEIGLETHSGIPYMSIIYLVNSHTTRHE